MTHDDAVQKAAKLLRLAQSDNPHEAALAAARAQEIIERYRLTGVSADINTESAEEPEEPIRDFAEPLTDDRNHPVCTWKMRLAMGVADLNGASIYYTSFSDGKRTMAVIARPSDAQTVRYLYSYLRVEIDRLARRDGKGYSTTWQNNYKLGAVDTVLRRLRQAQDEVRSAVRSEATSNVALVRVDKALARMDRQQQELTAFVNKKFGGRKGRAISERGPDDYGARAAGRKAGESVNLSSGRPLGSGQLEP